MFGRYFNIFASTVKGDFSQQTACECTSCYGHSMDESTIWYYVCFLEKRGTIFITRRCAEILSDEKIRLPMVSENKKSNGTAHHIRREKWLAERTLVCKFIKNDQTDYIQYPGEISGGLISTIIVIYIVSCWFDICHWFLCSYVRISGQVLTLMANHVSLDSLIMSCRFRQNQRRSSSHIS